MLTEGEIAQFEAGFLFAERAFILGHDCAEQFPVY
jgi:hypothetical protein